MLKRLWIEALFCGVTAVPLALYGMLCLIGGSAAIPQIDRYYRLTWRLTEVSGGSARLAGMGYLLLSACFVLWTPEFGSKETVGVRRFLGAVMVAVGSYLHYEAQRP
jgi:hypothetical protein